MKYILTIITALILLSCSDDATTNPSNNQLCGKMPVGSKMMETTGIYDSLRIVAIMPNPEGEDDYNEYFIIKNFGSNPVNIIGYIIKDDENITWDLPNTILNKCDSIKIVSNKTAQLLNSKDKIYFYKKLEQTALLEIQTLEYVDSESGIEERFDK